MKYILSLIVILITISYLEYEFYYIHNVLLPLSKIFSGLSNIIISILVVVSVLPMVKEIISYILSKKDVRFKFGGVEITLYEFERISNSIQKYGKNTLIKKVLWVDDIPQNNFLLIDFLEKKGIYVSISLDTNDALNKLEKEQFDLIISDVNRPSSPEAGIELTKQVRKTYHDIPIFIFCGFWFSKNRREYALENGVNEITSSGEYLLNKVLTYGRE